MEDQKERSKLRGRIEIGRQDRKQPQRNKMFQTIRWDLEEICVSFGAEIASSYFLISKLYKFILYLAMQ